jgi:SAM-dependent methyltransferase
MKPPVRVFEIPTAETLFPRGYVLANPDLERAFGSSETAARAHYVMFGRRELRRQLTPEFVEWNSNVNEKAERFQRFQDCFSPLPPEIQNFPISFGDRFADLGDYQSESANSTATPFAEEMTTYPTKRYIDIGAGLRDVVFPNCLYVEVYPSLTADVVIEPNSVLPFKTASLDGVGCFAVLEHVREPWKMAAEIARVVKPGGRIFIDWPFLQPTHGYPSHYYNATREGTRSLFASHFTITTLMTGGHQGPDFTVQWILSWLLDSIRDPGVRAKLANKTIGEIAAEPPQTALWHEVLKSLDEKGRERLSCGNHLAATRNDTPAGTPQGDDAWSGHDAIRSITRKPVRAWWRRWLADG